MKDKINLNGMVFYGYHGVLKEEKRIGQRFIVDVSLYCSLSEAGETDCLDRTIDYTGVYKTIKNVFLGNSYDLLEAVGNQIIKQILANYNCLGVKIKISKPSAPIPGILEDVSIEMERFSS